MSREGKLVKNTIILAIGTFFPKFAIFITLPVLTAYLSKVDYGTYDLIQTLIALVLPAATLQIHSAAFRYLIDVPHDEKGKTSIISNIFGFVIPTSLAALAIMFFLLGGQSLVLRLAICAYFLFDILVNANRQIIRGLGRNVDYAFSSFISAAGQILLTYVLLVGTNSGLLGAVIALAVTEMIASLYLLFKGKIYRYIDIKSLNGGVLKELLGYSWPMVPNSLSQWVMRAADRAIITGFMGAAHNAIYAVATKIPSILTFAQTTFNMAWQENASIVSKDKDVADYYSRMFRVLFDIVSGGMSVLIGLTPILFALLVNGDYDAAYNHMPIQFMATFALCMSTFWGGIFVAYKETKAVGLTTVISAAIHLAIVLSGIWFFGIYAASVASLVSYVALCVLRLLGVKKLVTIEYPWKHVAVVLAVLTAQCVMCFFRNWALDAVNLVLGAVVCVALNLPMLKGILAKLTKRLKKRA